MTYGWQERKSGFMPTLGLVSDYTLWFPLRPGGDYSIRKHRPNSCSWTIVCSSVHLGRAFVHFVEDDDGSFNCSVQRQRS